MPHALTNNLVHCVFSTKNRVNLIHEPDAVGRYIVGIARSLHISTLAFGGTANYLHLLIAVAPALALAEVMKNLKGNSSRWMNETRRGFAWQEGYGGFSVSPSQRDVVIRYIEGQEAHHRKWTYEQEYLTLLRKAAVEFDSRYVFG
jgi:REP element-mobilizing transposase RayT